MEELNYQITSDYYVNTGWCPSEKTALGKIDFDEIAKFLKREELDRNIKEEVLDLIDMVKGVYGSKAEASKDGVIVSRNNKNWKIEILI